MKKFLMLIVLFIFVISLSSCGRQRKDYIPDESEYIEWDGNYIYYANLRCKTNLTDEEVYLSEVTLGDEVYDISRVLDSKFKNDKAYLTFYTYFGSYRREYHSFFLIYSLSEEKIEYIYKCEKEVSSFNKILLIKDTYVIFQGDGSLQKLNLITNELEEFDCDSYEINNNYLTAKTKDNLYVTSCDEFEFERLEISSNNYYIEKIDGRDILSIVQYKSEKIDDNTYLKVNLLYYDFLSKRIYNPIKYEDNKYIYYIEQKPNTFVLGDQTYFEYKSGKFKDVKITFEDLVLNNVLYQVRANENSVYLEEIYVFNSEKEYKINRLIDNRFEFIEITITKPLLSRYYTEFTSEYVYYNLSTNILEDYEYTFNIRYRDIYTYNGMKYYFKIEKVPTLMMKNYAYYFYRVNLETNEDELLQFFFEDDDRHIARMYKQYFLTDDLSEYYPYEQIIRNS